MHAPLTSFGPRLRAARDASHMTQTALGDVTGFGHRSIVRYEAGGALPSIQAAAALAKALGTSLDELAGLSSSSDPELARLFARINDLPADARSAARLVLQALVATHAPQ